MPRGLPRGSILCGLTMVTKNKKNKGEKMKRRHVAIAICISFVTMLFLSGLIRNVQAEEVKDGIKQEYPEKKQEYKEKAKEKLAEFDKKITELEVKAKKEGSKVKTEVKEGIRELKDKRAALKEDMKKLEASSDKTWEAAKKKMNEAMADLEKTYDKVRAYFK